MNQQMQNKELFLEYMNALNGKRKTPELIRKYVSDEVLVEHIVFFDSVFPKYELLIDEMTAEGTRLVIRARLKGRHEGVFGNILPTYRDVEFNCVVGYEIENRMIISHWLIADQMALMEQLGAQEAVA
jgi:predicted ester cyclase